MFRPPMHALGLQNAHLHATIDWGMRRPIHIVPNNPPWYMPNSKKRPN